MKAIPTLVAWRLAHVAVETQLSVVGKIGAELQEKRTELSVHGIDVELVDHPGGLHDPRVGITVGVAAAFGAKQRCLFLRPPDEQHSLLPVEASQVLVHDVVFALALDEVHPRHLLVAGEPTHRGTERVGDLPQRRGGRDRQLQLALHIPQQARRELQLRDINIAIHPVDAPHLEHHVIGQDISDGAR
ncbi:MAG: hypothetical protein WBV74_15115 [Pseudonocardiaceae bacterium]